ncbi:MAG: cysteine--tRNA ligase [Deltaproteobacteria bacterium]|nr:cysteine--tRNA ligase [Deltaproteobacteria bacterium]
MTDLKIYNTLKKQKELFQPIAPGKVGIYVCGPTVYDACHIGHARSMVVFDVIVRYLKTLGYEVTYVRNFTDVDDKIINRANERGVSTQELSERYIQEFHEDMDALKVGRATIEPRATDHIDDIIGVVERLVSRGHAYEAGGDVFYAVETFEDYGRLSGRRLEEMEAGARVEVDERKRNPFDFVLWKSAKPGEPMWDSPWGKGRPGWHIECTAMSTHYLGDHFDIHGGGKDLIFPHHENEIAQSKGAFDAAFVNMWIHNGFLRIDQEKMSKSLGNFLMIRELLKEYDPETVRVFLLSNHYRSPIDYSDQVMTEAGTSLEKIYALLERIDEVLQSSDIGKDDGPGPLWGSFCDAMNDDFNTAKGIGLVFETVREMNRLMDDVEGNPKEGDLAQLALVRADLRRIGSVLGILTQTPAQFFEQQKADHLEQQGVDVAVIERLIAERAEARTNKDWARADQIRDELSAMNILIEDRPEGAIWRVK